MWSSRRPRSGSARRYSEHCVYSCGAWKSGNQAKDVVKKKEEWTGEMVVSQHCGGTRLFPTETLEQFVRQTQHVA